MVEKGYISTNYRRGIRSKESQEGWEEGKLKRK
jgi:hypothetical protein